MFTADLIDTFFAIKTKSSTVKCFTYLNFKNIKNVARDSKELCAIRLTRAFYIVSQLKRRAFGVRVCIR